jgi:hypothetical protein
MEAKSLTSAPDRPGKTSVWTTQRTRGKYDAAEHAPSSTQPPALSIGSLDSVRTVFWQAYKHLFPPHSLAAQTPSGSVVISWSIMDDPHARYPYAAPVLLRFDEALVDAMWKGLRPVRSFPERARRHHRLNSGARQPQAREAEVVRHLAHHQHLRDHPRVREHRIAACRAPEHDGRRPVEQLFQRVARDLAGGREDARQRVVIGCELQDLRRRPAAMQGHDEVFRRLDGCFQFLRQGRCVPQPAFAQGGRAQRQGIGQVLPVRAEAGVAVAERERDHCNCAPRAPNR